MDSQNRDDATHHALLHAAIAGLMGISACGTKEKEKIVTVAQAKGVVTSTVEKSYTLADFEAFCKGRGGLVQLHSSCGGVNSCKGASLSYGKLKEHSCRAANSCAGMTCVDLPADAGKSGKDILENTGGTASMEDTPACANCHGDGKTEFQLPVAPGTDETLQATAFSAKSETALVAAVAFGLHGTKTNGTAYANMPGFHTVYSRAELERLVTHIKTLKVKVTPWEDPK